MHWKRVITIALAAWVLGGAPAGVAQPTIDVLGGEMGAGAGAVPEQSEVDALFYFTGDSLTGWDAMGRLGYNRTIVPRWLPFLEAMQQSTWDLIVMDAPDDDIADKETTAQLLEDHVAAGGRLLVNFNNLDEWPRLQKLLGVETASERLIPSDVTQTDPPHPSYPYRTSGWPFPSLYDPWADSGDSLRPAIDATTAAVFKDNELGAVILANDRHTIVNGFDWESYPGGAGILLVEHQMEYLMRCPADFDQSTGQGRLDIFDFLEFQRLFVEKDYRANMAFDKNLDIFDFLVFQNEFVTGCK